MTLGIALIALVIAVAAFYRTGGMGSLGEQVGRVGVLSGDAAKFARGAIADTLERIERLIRGKQESPSETGKVPSETANVPSWAGNAPPEEEKDPLKIGPE